jgi:hypothetical protein
MAGLLVEHQLRVTKYLVCRKGELLSCLTPQLLPKAALQNLRPELLTSEDRSLRPRDKNVIASNNASTASCN